MGTRTLSVEVPDEQVALLGTPEAAAARAKEALVPELLREARISQGKAARLLEISRWDVLQRMAKHRIPSGPDTPEELRREIEAAERFLGQP